VLKLIDAAVEIDTKKMSGDDIGFMHSILCQVGLPRSKVNGYQFERKCGAAAMYVAAGKIWNGEEFVQQMVPYGTMPRLILAYLNALALRQRSAQIEIGNSAREFMKMIGKNSSGGVPEVQKWGIVEAF